METIPVEQIDQINAKTQKNNQILLLTIPFMESGACPPFIKPSKQDEDRGCDLIPIIKTVHISITSNFFIHSLYIIPK